MKSPTLSEHMAANDPNAAPLPSGAGYKTIETPSLAAQIAFSAGAAAMSAAGRLGGRHHPGSRHPKRFGGIGSSKKKPKISNAVKNDRKNRRRVRNKKRGRR